MCICLDVVHHIRSPFNISYSDYRNIKFRIADIMGHDMPSSTNTPKPEGCSTGLWLFLIQEDDWSSEESEKVYHALVDVRKKIQKNETPPTTLSELINIFEEGARNHGIVLKGRT
jgi:hypothetical protein